MKVVGLGQAPCEKTEASVEKMKPVGRKGEGLGG